MIPEKIIATAAAAGLRLENEAESTAALSRNRRAGILNCQVPANPGNELIDMRPAVLDRLAALAPQLLRNFRSADGLLAVLDEKLQELLFQFGKRLPGDGLSEPIEAFLHVLHFRINSLAPVPPGMNQKRP
jgi:hypothetical protein